MPEMTEELKQEIDSMSYFEMFRQRRFAPIGHKYFNGETGIYFQKVMGEKEKNISQAERVAISKKIGW